MDRLSRSMLTATAALALFAGCTTTKETAQAPGGPVYQDETWKGEYPMHVERQTAAPVVQPEAKPVTVTDERQHSSYAFPTGHAESSMLLVERDLPAQIVSGQEFWYDLKVTNINHQLLKNVTLRDDCATSLKLGKAEPMPVTTTPPYTWNLGDMAPGESRTVRVLGTVAGDQPFTSCASATYNSPVCLTSPVVSPALKLTMTAPPQVTPCDTIPVQLSVINTGTGAARDVKLAYQLPEGWTTMDGRAVVPFTIDSLAPNQKSDFTVNAKANRTGDFTSRAVATASPGLKVEATPVPTVVRQAALAVNVEGPEHVYAGRPVTFKYTVANTGTAAATTAVLESPLSPLAKFVSATDNGVLRNGVVVWDLQTLPVKATKTFSMTVEATNIGEMDGAATAKAYCANAATDRTSVMVMGIPALMLEVTDSPDPIEVGAQTSYDIVITNQGSAPATNVKIAAMLEATEQYISVAGATAKADKGVITFDPISTIAPKAKVTLRVTVKGVDEGDVRFKVSMTADQLKRPVEETESTHIYR